MSAAEQYKRELGAELAILFEEEFKFFRSRRELRRKRRGGDDVVLLSGANKWSPIVDVNFYFGRNYDAAKKMEKLLGMHRMPYHIQQYSLNAKYMSGLGYSGDGTWEVNIEESPSNVALKVRDAILSIAFPFFERFTTLEVAQIALSNNDSWCFSADGAGYHRLFMVDAALGEIGHFQEWMASLDSLYREQAKADLEKYIEVMANEI